jgi:hypothetical protein
MGWRVARPRSLGERVDGSCDYQAEQRERNSRLHEHRVLGAVGEWHYVSRAERGRVREPNLQRAAAYIVLVMSARAQQDRVVVALAAVTCGRLSRAATVRAGRGQCSASADQYCVKVTEPRSRSVVARGPISEHSPEVVLEHWGGDAQMLTLRSSVTGAVGPSGPLERARVAARTVNYYDLDSLRIAYPDGAELLAGRIELVLYGPRRRFLRRRDRLLRASVNELL